MDTVEDNLHFADLGIPGITSLNRGDWQDVAALIVGDEEVSILKVRIDKEFPIVRIASSDPEAIQRVYDSAIAYSDELASA